MAYREVYRYGVLCDRCGGGAPEGPSGWWTPAIADRAAIEAGWVITRTEHLCPLCQSVEAPDDVAGLDSVSSVPRPALRPAASASSRPDVCWPASSPAADQSWEGSP
jgi:hypothetical protein